MDSVNVEERVIKNQMCYNEKTVRKENWKAIKWNIEFLKTGVSYYGCSNLIFPNSSDSGMFEFTHNGCLLFSNAELILEKIVD